MHNSNHALQHDLAEFVNIIRDGSAIRFSRIGSQYSRLRIPFQLQMLLWPYSDMIRTRKQFYKKTVRAMRDLCLTAPVSNDRQVFKNPTNEPFVSLKKFSDRCGRSASFPSMVITNGVIQWLFIEVLRPKITDPTAFVLAKALYLVERLRHRLLHEKCQIGFGTPAIPFPIGGSVFQQSVVVREIVAHRPGRF
jgi:hypothetical protein